MSEETKEEGIIQAVVERLEAQRLPRALDIKDKVDKGGLLDEFDIEFLEQALEDAQHIKPLVDKHPEWQTLAVRVMSLYQEITDRALKNEQAKG